MLMNDFIRLRLS